MVHAPPTPNLKFPSTFSQTPCANLLHISIALAHKQPHPPILSQSHQILRRKRARTMKSRYQSKNASLIKLACWFLCATFSSCSRLRNCKVSAYEREVYVLTTDHGCKISEASFDLAYPYFMSLMPRQPGTVLESTKHHAFL